MTQGSRRLPGKSAVITGAAFGIGRATAVLFAREGAQLTLTDIQDEPLLAFADGAIAVDARVILDQGGPHGDDNGDST